MKPAISIVVPARNSAATLQSCLESIRAQSFRDYELIVVDGMSRDGTADIARRYADEVMTCPGSVPASRNLGFSRARGGIFLSIDSDMVLGEGLLLDVSK
ncbi:MAG: glycosyltransferase, partial [Candidatus Micrarchaeota archaeon]